MNKTDVDNIIGTGYKKTQVLDETKLLAGEGPHEFTETACVEYKNPFSIDEKRFLSITKLMIVSAGILRFIKRSDERK